MDGKDGKIKITSVTIEKNMIKLDIRVHQDDGPLFLSNSFEYNIEGLGNYFCHVNPGVRIFLYKIVRGIDDVVAELRNIYSFMSKSEYTKIYEIGGPITIEAFYTGGVGFFKSKRLKRSKRLNKLKYQS
jgi:hypothetical protein